MSLNPDSARFFRISHPKPPAPLHIALASIGTKLIIGKTYITLQKVSTLNNSTGSQIY